MIAEFLNQLARADLFEAAGLVSGLLCVWLLIRQSIWTWPIGLLYALVSLFVFYNSRLYSEFGLHIYYVLMNAYGWYYWSKGGTPSSQENTSVPISRITPANAAIVLLLVIIGVPLLAETLNAVTDAEMAYPDSAITVLSFAGMWMTARKYIENWYVWLVVDVLATGLYIHKGIELYAVLYGVYIIMAVMGWLAWQRTLLAQEDSLPLADAISS